MLGLADTIKAIFPPFPIPGFAPNFTGYDLDQQNIDWHEMFNMSSPDSEPIYVRSYVIVKIGTNVLNTQRYQ